MQNPESFNMDNKNCGGCGQACDPKSAKPQCVMGMCMACKNADEKFCPEVDKCVVSNSLTRRTKVAFNHY